MYYNTTKSDGNPRKSKTLENVSLYYLLKVLSVCFSNHLNDLENIPAFLFLGLLYIFVEPSTSVALWHFRIFTISRILHTIAYQLPLPQPSRALFYTTGLLVCASMAFQILAKIH